MINQTNSTDGVQSQASTRVRSERTCRCRWNVLEKSGRLHTMWNGLMLPRCSRDSSACSVRASRHAAHLPWPSVKAGSGAGSESVGHERGSRMTLWQGAVLASSVRHQQACHICRLTFHMRAATSAHLLGHKHSRHHKPPWTTCLEEPPHPLARTCCDAMSVQLPPRCIQRSPRGSWRRTLASGGRNARHCVRAEA